MQNNLMPSAGEFARILPEIILTVFGILIMMLEPVTAARAKRSLAVLALVGLGAALYASAFVGANSPGAAFSQMILVDSFTTYFRVLTLAVGFLVVLCSMSYLRREGLEGGEYYALVLFSVVGQCVMAAANELIMVFIGLEISSIASYILIGYLRDDKRGSEAAIKYFLLGSFATAFLLYGIAWIYGLLGTTNLYEVRQLLSAPDVTAPITLVSAAAALMFVGFAFKVSVAPFQVWAPDVYQGAPAPVSAFLSAGPKAAAFAVFMRVFMTAFGPISERWEPLLWISALLTMLIGNFAALSQTNVKRLLAYSSIAHAGYVLVAMAAASQVGVQAALFYLATYAFMNVGVFAIIAHMARQGEQYVQIDDLAGLAQRQPGIALALTIFLLSLIGVPFTGGFFGKFYIFKAALDSNLVWLTILGLLSSGVAAYYYLRLIMVMYMREPSAAMSSLPPASAGTQVVAWSSAFITVLLGLFPTFVMNYAGRSASFMK